MSGDLQLNVKINVNNSAGGEISKVAAQADKAFKGTALEQRKAEAGLRTYTGVINRAGAAHRAAGHAARQGGVLAASGLDRQKQAAVQAGSALDKTAEAAKRAQGSLRGLGQQDLGRLSGGLSRVRRSLLQIGQTAKDVLRGISGVGSGVAAMGYVGARAMAKPVEYEHRLALMTNTASSRDDDLSARQNTMRQLDSAVVKAVRYGGGSRDAAAGALDSMLASGAVERQSAMDMLPQIQKIASVSGADSTELADIVIRGLQNGFFKSTDEAMLGLQAALVAGMEGGFEIKDMARWLPQMMASYQGRRDMEGFKEMLTHAQAALTTAGSKDMAGNNVVNLYGSIMSQVTAKAIKDNFGIDLAKSFTHNREKNGMSAMETFISLINDRVVGGNKEYQALQARLAKAGNDAEKQQIMNDMGDIMQRSVIGELIRDRQALMALTGLMNQSDYMQKIKGELNRPGDAVEPAFDLMASTTSHQALKLANEAEIAQSGVHAGVKGPLDSLLGAASGLAREFPRLTTMVAGAGTAFAALLGGGAAWAGIGMILKRGPGKGGIAGGGLGGLAGAAAGVVPVFVTNMGAGLSSMDMAGDKGKRRFSNIGPGKVARAAGLLNIGFGLWNAFEIARDGSLSESEKIRAQAGNAGSALGGVGGAAAGALIGTAVFPGVGTVIGGVLGSVLGSWLGEKGATGIVDGTDRMIELTINNSTEIDGRVVAETVDNYFMLQAARSGM